MTRNQQRATALARDICDGKTAASTLSDADWALLLLAAGLNACRSRPLLVGHLVLERAHRRVGYFAELVDAEERVEVRLHRAEPQFAEPAQPQPW